MSSRDVSTGRELCTEEESVSSRGVSTGRELCTEEESVSSRDVRQEGNYVQRKSL